MGPDRHVVLEGASNFRDVGGYPAAGGRVVAAGRLYRADALSRLTAGDLDVLDRLGIRTVVDLRTPGELAERGRITWPGRDLAYHHLPVMDVLPPEDTYREGWSTSAGVAAAYLDVLDGGGPAVAAALEAVADPAALPAVVHCAAGKDRTGLLVAIALGLLGVSDDDIAADYALSGPAMERWLAGLRDRDPEAAARWERSGAAVVHAEAATMHAVLAAVRVRHGDLDAMVASMGAPDVGARLRGALLDG